MDIIKILFGIIACTFFTLVVFFICLAIAIAPIILVGLFGSKFWLLLYGVIFFLIFDSILEG